MRDRTAKIGVLCGVAAYLSWGLFPIYFKAVKQVDAGEILCHRIVWSAVFLAVLMALRGRWGDVVAALRDRRVVLTLLGSTILIAINWFTYILATIHAHVLQASLGYFINPLVSILLGYVFLGERLRPWQKASVTLAVAGVLFLTVNYGQVPSIALILAGSFGFYGLLRKTVRVEAMAGLTVETALLAPLAAGWLVYLAAGGRLSFGHAPTTVNVLLLLAGVVTSVPLLWFTTAARRLRLSTLGFLQYLAPTGQFLLGVLAYSEPFTRADAVAFGLIWAGLAIYSVDTLRRKQA
ncbi:MAG TPA: EamA family transporter RarD [Phycisphaerae bacterium]|jgi:chloramphenicol-sensitive protein RarD|nr:EamA family transporter RarD [Phycisphaerae bacterium]HOB73299.1 EamA family transporter RarD [Phycisphaerae bacterium]HOJ55719.1 EamA family transporter RarD [Phycisphaerae bacterium]HOL26118.1 EamA family transporter RarD [Phycisphaerae bacterium]HPP22034.1 EamA family transporter RarD [Phycisphaerae bacterium]